MANASFLQQTHNQMPTPGTDPSDFAQDGQHDGQALGVARCDNPDNVGIASTYF